MARVTTWVPIWWNMGEPDCPPATSTWEVEMAPVNVVLPHPLTLSIMPEVKKVRLP